MRSRSFATALALLLAGVGILLAACGRDETTIHVTEATYGMSCGAAKGNVTQKILAICNATQEGCAFSVDVGALGDPAPGCAKYFSVS